MLPASTRPARKLPAQPRLDASAATLERGRLLYDGHCKSCHGTGAVARAHGSVPDLRYADSATHGEWAGIVIGGARRANGMPAFELGLDDAEAIRAYVLSLAEEIRAAQ